MAAGLTGHILWTLKELFTTVVINVQKQHEKSSLPIHRFCTVDRLLTPDAYSPKRRVADQRAQISFVQLARFSSAVCCFCGRSQDVGSSIE